ncbi:MAG: DUF3800 domain-containing protein [Stellaceae bacterium]
MAWFLFIDESGQDHHDSPYEVLCGVSIQDETLWGLIRELHDAEVAHFGRRYSGGARELKGKKILKKKVFRHAGLNCGVLPHEVPELSKAVLDNGATSNSVRHLKALALAKIAYVSDVFNICSNSGCRVFASVVENDAPKTTSDGLRKDYAYLFQRFYYFLEDESTNSGIPQRGIIVFDELEKSRSHILIDQAHRYFKDTATGRARASLIIPEPFFVHSDLTTGVQIADLFAYCISWGFRIHNVMRKPCREDLAPFSRQIAGMRYKAVREMYSKPHYEIWSIAHIADLRTHAERLDGDI